MSLEGIFLFSEDRANQKKVYKEMKNKHSKKVHRRMDKLRLLTEVSELYLSGKTQPEIAALYSVSVPTVSDWLTDIRQVWRETQVKNFNEMQQVELMKLDRMEAEMWTAWELSKKGINKRVKGTISRTGKMGGDEDYEEEENLQSHGDVRYMESLIKIKAQRIKLLGLDAPIKVEGLFEVKHETLLTKANLTLEEREKMFNVLLASLEQKQIAEGIDDNNAIQGTAISRDVSGRNSDGESDSLPIVFEEVG